MKVVIVGGGAGGISTASNIRKIDKNIEITVLTRDNNVAYSPCAIPYVLAGKIKSFDDIIMKKPEDYKEKDIDVITEAEVTSVDSNKKVVTYVKEGKEIKLDYDKLVLATGGNPFIPPMNGSDLEGVFQIRNIKDGIKVQEWAKDSKNAIVIGAGLIGIEIAFGLKKLGLNVTITEMLPQIVPRSLDKDMADILTNYLELEGINVVLGQPITDLNGEEKVESACFGDGTCIDADMVILATGVRPELELAKMAGCEIVSADSMQIYDEMSIGTAKPDKEEMQGIKHYLVGTVSPSKRYSVSEYKKDAICAIEEIISNKKSPIVVGGTGLYVNSLIYGIDYPEIETDLKYRAELEEMANEKGLEYLYKMAKEIDEEAMKNISVNDKKRIIRVLEIYKETGKTKTELEIESRKNGIPYEYKVFAINMPREILYDRINKRVDIMIGKGLIEEVEQLYSKYGKQLCTAAQGIGYKEVIDYLNKEITKEEMIEKVKMETRRYAKRQLTWFRKIPNITWLDGLNNMQNNVNIILEGIKSE